MRKLVLLSVLAVVFFYVPLAAKQLKNEKALNEKATLKEYDNGLFVQEIFGVPVNYRDKDGKWKKINTSAAQNRGFFACEQNSLRSVFYDDYSQGVVYGESGKSITWKTVSMALTGASGGVIRQMQKGNSRASGAGNTVRYDNAFEGAADEYIIGPGSVKNNIVLHSKPTGIESADFLEVTGEFLPRPGFTVFNEAGGISGQAETGNGFCIKSGGEDYFINPAYIHDSPAPSGFDKQYAPEMFRVNYELFVENGKITVKVKIPASWLADPGTRYPVYIDPTVSLGIPNWQSFNSQQDTDINSASAVNNGTATTMTVGRDQSGVVWRGLYRFDLSSIPPTVVIRTAFFNVYNHLITTGSTGADYYQVHEVIANPVSEQNWWSETGATWPQRTGTEVWVSAGGDFDTMLSGRVLINAADPVAYRQFSIGSLVSGWVKGTKTNNGLIVKIENAREAAGVHGEIFHSRENTNVPYIAVEYYESGSGAVSSWAQDTVLREGMPYANYGTYTYLDFWGSTAGDRRRSVAQFDLSMLPSNIVVTSASVNMYVYTRLGNSATVDMYAVTNTAWVDTGAGWVSRTASDTWATAGGDTGSTVIGYYTFPNVITAGYYSWPMPVTVVAGWLDGYIQNNGVLFRVRNEEQDRGYRAYSHENLQYQPRLDITYTAAAGFTPPELLQPLGGEIADQNYLVKWKWGSKDDIADPFDLRYYIEYSGDSGATWYPLATTTAKANMYSWDTSSLAEGTQYRVRIAAYDYLSSLSYSVYSASGDFTVQRFAGGSYLEVASASAQPASVNIGESITVVYNVYNAGFETFDLLSTPLSAEGSGGGTASLVINNNLTPVERWGTSYLTWIYSATNAGIVTFGGRVDAEGVDTGTNTMTSRGITNSVVINSPTSTVTETWTASPEHTPTHTPTLTATGTVTETVTESSTPTGTPTFTGTATATPSTTPTATLSVTPSTTPTATLSVTETVTETITQTATASSTITITITYTVTFTETATETATQTVTGTPTGTQTQTVTGTVTETATASFTDTPTMTHTGTFTSTQTHTPSATITPTLTAVPTGTPVTPLYVYGNIIKGQGSIKLKIKLKNSEAVKIYIYNIAGELMYSAAAQMPAGWNEWEWQGVTGSGQKAAGGIYILRVNAEGRNTLIKIPVK